jgi:hypothetical protein
MPFVGGLRTDDPLSFHGGEGAGEGEDDRASFMTSPWTRTFRHATTAIIVKQTSQNCTEVIPGNQNLRYSANMTG